MTEVVIHATRWFSTHHESAADLLAGRERAMTAPTFPLLAGRARRFTSLVTQMHLEVCGALPREPAEPGFAVFATCEGEIQTAEKLIADFREAATVSSARFALSVHNTPSGLYSVATGSAAPTTTVTGANAVAAGWLEASLTAIEAGRTVLLSIADEPVPAGFQGPIGTTGVAAAFLIGPGSAGGRRAQLAITPCSGDTRALERISTPNALARVVDAATRPDSATIVLGQIGPDAILELRIERARVPA